MFYPKFLNLWKTTFCEVFVSMQGVTSVKPENGAWVAIKLVLKCHCIF